MIRTELRTALRRWSEVLTGLGIMMFGLWALQARDSFFQFLAALVILAGLGITIIGWRRLRFQREGAGPGIVQITEGQISYFGPEDGGFIALRDLIELHLMEHGTTWLMIAQDDTRLEIPVSATGTEVLFDAFSSLPGLRMQSILAALDDPAPPAARALWLHPSRQDRHLQLR